MIYSASLNVPVKKAMGKQAMQSTLKKICSQMSIDPETTDMDVVILGPKDMQGVFKDTLQSAVDERHPDVCVIYIYEKDKDSELIDCEYKKQVKKIRDVAIQEAVEEFVGQHKIRQGKQVLRSADFDVPEDDEIGDVVAEKSNRVGFAHVDKIDPNAMKAEQQEEPEELPGDDEPDSIETMEPIDFTPVTEPEQEEIDTDKSVSDPLNAPDEELPPMPPQSDIEEQLARMNVFEDWELFKERLSKDSIVKELIHENTEYAGLVQMLEVLDKEIETVWRDPVLSSDQKFEKIKEIGLRRSVVRATSNSINVEKVISIISTMMLAAKRAVEDKVNSIDAAMYHITTGDKSIMDTTNIDKAIAERTKVQLDLLEMVRGIIDMYKAVDDLVTDEVIELDRHLPSANQFINEMVKPLGTQIFTPTNTAALANKLMRALESNRILASQLEDTVNAVVGKMFELCEKDEIIIRYQQNMINLLKANRVEDIVIVDSLIKNCLSLWVGADNTGRSATAITYCGCNARKQNTLLIDNTGRAKFEDYGIEPVSMEEFLSNRIERMFLCVDTGRILNSEELQNLIMQVKSRLNYYAAVHVIVAPEDEQGLDQLSADARVVHYVTDCTPVSMKAIKAIVAKHKSENIARKLVTIDTPVSPLMVADNVGIDPTLCKLITLPSVPAIRACALKHDRPFEYNDVVMLFEEAFR